MSLTLNASIIYARRYNIARAGLPLYVDLDLRALWRPLDSGSYRVTRQDNGTPVASGPWALAVTGTHVRPFFETVLDGAFGGTHPITVNSSSDYAMEHDVTYNAGDASEADYLIRLDTLANRRLIVDKSTGDTLDGGRWFVNALSGPQVQAFFESMLHAATGVAPV